MQVQPPGTFFALIVQSPERIYYYPSRNFLNAYCILSLIKIPKKMKKITCTLAVIFSCISMFSQNVGIGVDLPQYKLDIGGTLHTSSDIYAEGFMGLGTTSPAYKFQVNNGPVAFYNTAGRRIRLNIRSYKAINKLRCNPDLMIFF